MICNEIVSVQEQGKLGPINVGIIDDDWLSVSELVEDMEEIGHNPIVFEGPYGDEKERLVEEVKAKVDFVICDQNLNRTTEYASFKGAEIAREFYSKNIPSVLITSYRDSEIESIRYHSKDIIKFVRREELRKENLEEILKYTCKELLEGPGIPRKYYRTLIRVGKVWDEEASNDQVELIIPGWEPRTFVNFPLKIFPQHLQNRIREGQRFFAKVNISTEEVDGLYVYDIETAPEIDDA